MAAKAIVVDLDGTIWDSYPLYAALIEELAGVPANQTEVDLHGGASIIRLLRNHRVSRARFVQLACERSAGLGLYEGVRSTLEELHGRSVSLAVFTALPRDLAESLLISTGLDRYFTATVHAGNCRARKPSPAGIYRAMEVLGIEAAADVIYVGDRTVDSETAQNASVSFAWARYGYQATPPRYVSVTLESFAQLIQP